MASGATTRLRRRPPPSASGRPRAAASRRPRQLGSGTSGAGSAAPRSQLQAVPLDPVPAPSLKPIASKRPPARSQGPRGARRPGVRRRDPGHREVRALETQHREHGLHREPPEAPAGERPSHVDRRLDRPVVRRALPVSRPVRVRAHDPVDLDDHPRRRSMVRAIRAAISRRRVAPARTRPRSRHLGGVDRGARGAVGRRGEAGAGGSDGSGLPQYRVGKRDRQPSARSSRVASSSASSSVRVWTSCQRWSAR